MKARINDGRLVELFSGDLTGRFHPDLIATLVDVPDDAQPGWALTNGVWGPYVEPAPLITADDVRAEASRRMQAAFGARDGAHLEIIIANATREVARLNQMKVGVPHPEGGWLVEPRDWTAEERLRLAQLHGADQLLEAIRAASNVLEVMQPVPADYADDRQWPGA